MAEYATVSMIPGGKPERFALTVAKRRPFAAVTFRRASGISRSASSAPAMEARSFVAAKILSKLADP
jgi:hypothetical protein